MITTIEENDYGLYFNLKPETPNEVALLARYALNANSGKASVYMSFYKEPYLSISLSKRKKAAQRTSINPAK